MPVDGPTHPAQAAIDPNRPSGTPGRGANFRSRRAARLARTKAARRGRVWRIALPCVMVLAGVLFATSAETSRGSDLRGGRRADLPQLIQRGNKDLASTEATATELRRSINQATRSRARTDERLVQPQQKVDELTGPAGLGKVRGPALSVSLDDAPRLAGTSSIPEGASADDVVVHQQDVQAVVNALWAGGAEAMTIMGVRVISTSAVRCVGNTLLLHGRTYSPPFVITAIGNVSSMRGALDRSPGVSLYRRAARAFNLGYTVRTPGVVTLPGFNGPTGVRPSSIPNR